MGGPAKVLDPEDLAFRAALLTTGTLLEAADALGWPYARLTSRLRRTRHATWWRDVKAARARARRRERQARWRERARERGWRPGYRQTLRGRWAPARLVPYANLLILGRPFTDAQARFMDEHDVYAWL